MARTAVTKGRLVKLEGVEDVLKQIEKRIDATRGAHIKKAYWDAAKVLMTQIHSRIRSVVGSPSLKAALHASVVATMGKENKPNVLVGMSQRAGAVRLPGRFVPNPHWIEKGTKERATKSGRRTGRLIASPYFRPAVAAARPMVAQALADGLKAVIVDSDA